VLDPLKAEVRLLQLAINSKAFVIDLRQVPLSSPSPAPAWSQTFVGHNLSFDVKMLMANGVDLVSATIMTHWPPAALIITSDRSRRIARHPARARTDRESLR
jgi:hypothetical protein